MALRLSVVVPVKDDAPALRACLAHLAAQTEPPAEVVVVDNGSTDDSAAVARTHGAVVVPEPHPGIPAAASTGYDAATGDVIVRCDADSRPPADWLARIREAFERDPWLGALTGGGEYYDAGPVGRVVGRLYLASYYLSLGGALAHPPLWGSNMALRRAVWEDARGRVHRFDPEVHDDADLAFALAPGTRVVHDPTLLVGVSARSLRGARQLHRRFRRGARTVAAHRSRPAWRRWEHRLRAAGVLGPARATPDERV